MEDPRLRGEGDVGLVAEAREESEKAFRKLVERYHPMAFAVVRGVLGNRSDVEDVAQDVFIKIFRSLSGFRGDSKFSTWVYTIARNEAINAARKKIPTEESLDDVVVETPAAARPDEQYRRKVQQEHLERCLSEIDENYRVVLELRYMGEMSYDEIGETTGLPIGTVKTYIHRGKVALRKVMNRSPFVEASKQRDHS